jgi:CBS domain-containing protein
MAHLSRVLMNESAVENAVKVQSSRELKKLFSAGGDIDEPLTARDVMRLPRWSVSCETSASECAKIMSNYRLRALPVVDDEGFIIGEITTEILFRYGLPDFFTRLKSVSFVAEFDPFEKYFADERDTPAEAIMSRDPHTIAADSTIMEIVFDLAVKKYSKLYVVDDNNRWIGTITNGTILDNVINA